MKKQYYEVRCRERVSEDKWVKKSRFYYASSPEGAVKKYQDQCKRRHIPSGHIMWAEKVPREKVLGIGEFFKLGDNLLKEFKGEDNGAREKTSNGFNRSKSRRDIREEAWS